MQEILRDWSYLRRRFSIRFLCLTFILGFFFGPIGDFCHVYFGIAYYPRPAYWGIDFFYLPVWVFPEFGLAACSLAFFHPLQEYFINKELKSPSFKVVMSGLTVFVLQYILTSLLPFPPGGLSDFIIGLISFLVWFFLDRRWVGFILAVGAMLAGTFVEISIVRAGYFAYQENYRNLFEVAPSWLPALYFTAGIVMGNLGRYLVFHLKPIEQLKN